VKAAFLLPICLHPFTGFFFLSSGDGFLATGCGAEPLGAFGLVPCFKFGLAFLLSWFALSEAGLTGLPADFAATTFFLLKSPAVLVAAIDGLPPFFGSFEIRVFTCELLAFRLFAGRRGMRLPRRSKFLGVRLSLDAAGTAIEAHIRRVVCRHECRRVRVYHQPP
jgi:hypothetical protein